MVQGLRSAITFFIKISSFPHSLLTCRDLDSRVKSVLILHLGKPLSHDYRFVLKGPLLGGLF